VRECTEADGDVADTLQGEQKGSASSLTHYLTRQILPPYDMLIFIQSPQDQSSASKWSQE
jgi:hypothetical protein